MLKLYNFAADDSAKGAICLVAMSQGFSAPTSAIVVAIADTKS
jgi:hypothetical protein